MLENEIFVEGRKASGDALLVKSGFAQSSEAKSRKGGLARS